MFGKAKVKEDERINRIILRITEGVKQEILGTAIASCDEKIMAVLNAEDAIVRLKRTVTRLEGRIAELKKDEAQVASTRKIQDAEIKALIKLKEDQSKMELKALEVDLKNSFKDKELQLVEKFHKDLSNENAANQQRQDTFFDRILHCLPNVNVKLGEDSPEKEDTGAKKISK